MGSNAPTTGIEITDRQPYEDGRTFGDAGPYVIERGTATYSIDPSQFPMIVDLDRVPTTNGIVTFHGDVRVLRPLDADRASPIGIVDVVNRGRPMVERFLNRSKVPLGPEVAEPDSGDGFAFERGWTVLSVGWQHDVVPHDLLFGLRAPQAVDDDGGPLSSWASVELHPATDQTRLPLAAANHRAPAPLPDASEDAVLVTSHHHHGPWVEVTADQWKFDGQTHIEMADGFEADRLYSVRYRSAETEVGGTGLVALREAARLLHASPGVEKVIGLGVSQNGRLLRHFLSLGLNDPGAFDAIHAHVAGARRGEFNLRQGSPGALFRPSVAMQPPFDRSVFDAQWATGNRPKVMQSNTSTEYWRNDASLCHTSLDGTKDHDHDDNVRVYHHSGTQHVAAGLPQLDTDPATGIRAAQGFNVVDNRVLLRAEMVAMAEWVLDDVEPPTSSHPKISDGTLVTRATALAALEPLGLSGLDLESLPTVGPYDFGPNAPEEVAFPVAVADGERYTSLVPALDADGNELGGIRLPDLEVPLGTHTGWNVRAGRSTLVPTKGTTRFFSSDEIHRRYDHRDNFLQLVNAIFDQLLAERRVLAEDRQLVIDSAAGQWDAIEAANDSDSGRIAR